MGCDGAHSKVRDTAGIAFPGTTYPEVNRLAQVTVPDSVTRLGNGDLDVPGLGRPDAYIAWAATAGEPADTAVPALREALSRWFGTPFEH